MACTWTSQMIGMMGESTLWWTFMDVTMLIFWATQLLLCIILMHLKHLRKMSPSKCALTLISSNKKKPRTKTSIQVEFAS